MKVNKIIDKLKQMDQKYGELIPEPNIVEATGCENIEINVLDKESAILSLTGCGIFDKIKRTKSR